MSESGADENLVGGEAAIAEMARRAGIAAAAGASARPILVLDESASRILHASAAADALRRGVSSPDGALHPALRLDAQARRASLDGARPMIARLQFDLRRIAPPATCLVARATLPDGAAAIIVSVTDRPPRLRPLPGWAEARGAAITAPATEPLAQESLAQEPLAQEPVAQEPVASPPPVPEEPPAFAPPRFTWRSDPAGTITQISGLIGEGARAAMIERSWASLSESGSLQDAQGVLAALSAQRTFRAILVTLRPGAGAAVIDLELSGAPLGRGGHGFAGFGLVRPNSAAQEIASEGIASEGGAAKEVVAREIAPVAAARDAPVETPPPEPADPVPPAPPILAASAQADALSSNEHDAFREIARALGARFAGDDAPDAPADEREPPQAPACSVTPFPARPPEPLEDPAVAATLEHLPSGALVYRGDALLFANRRLLDLAGYADLSAIEAAGGLGRLFPGLPPHERPAPEAPAAMAAADGRSLPVDLQHSGMEWRGARAELVLARAAPAADAAGKLAALRVSQDFAARRGADAVAIIDALEDGVATLDASGRVLTLNRSAAALFGLDPREIVGGGFPGLFAPESAMQILGAIHGPPGEVREALARRRGGAPLRLTLTPLRADGSVSVLIRDGAPVRQADAESASARAAAEAASAQKSDFLATISHEIRTPMNSILGFADVMLAESFGPIGAERYRGYLRDIHASGSHVLSLVNDLLDLAKIEAGRLDLAFTDVPLNDLVSGCVALMQPQAARERVVVRTSFSADLTTLLADERSVRQAALNVIANAIQFTEAGGQVIVSTTIAERGEIALRVRDTGIGMTPDEVETALEPFRQVAVAGGRKGGGTGLGLPLTKALVEANHGRFVITSRKDEGTLVEMLFPAPEAMSA